MSENNFPRVTEICRILDPDAYASVPAATLAAAADRGQRLHQLACIHLSSMLHLCDPPSEIDAADVAAYDTLCGWIKDYEVSPLLVERTVVCNGHHYQGTPDALVELTLRGKRRRAVVDFKFTAAILPINRVQLCAYWRLPEYTTAAEAMLIHIQPDDGKLKIVRLMFGGPEWPAFLSALNIYHWRTQHHG